MAFTLKRMMISVLIIISGVFVFGDDDVEGNVEANRVTTLPEQPAVRFNQYAGYMTVDRVKGTRLFYWFIEATQSPEQKPVLLWLNGGPGCSSVGYGGLEEIGPFYAKAGSPALKLNKNSWNKVANLLFLESPIGVGFSYSNNTSKDKLGQNDNATAMLSYTFLHNWFKKFPDYMTHDFYIAGESYAGHYIPQLSQVIISRNQNTTKENQINLKGIAMGNPELDYEAGWIGMIEYSWSHALISDRNYDYIKQNCNFSTQNSTDECNDGLDEMLAILSSINKYSLYTAICHNTTTTSSTYSKFSGRLNAGPVGGVCEDDGFDPCSENYIQTYMNRVDVQKAFHAIDNTSQAHPWSLCSNDIINSWDWNFESAYSSILSILNDLAHSDLSIWIYSGDADARISVTSTRLALKKLGLGIVEDWAAWYSNNEIAGWTVLFEEGMRFVTVRGGAHEVPHNRGSQALEMISHFLNNTNLPSST